MKMKGKHFFIENGKQIEIKEFDYYYVRNALLKEYKPGVARSYKYTVVVDRTYDSVGNPVFDVRTLDLDHIYFDTVSLTMKVLMLDDIHFEKLTVRDMPMPPLQKEYMDWKNGITVPKKALPVQAVAIPEVPEKVRTAVDENDERIGEIMVLGLADEMDRKVKPLVVLDWIENFDICNHELSLQSQGISQLKLDLSTAIEANGEYLESLHSKLRSTLEELFPLKPGFLTRMFGNKDFVAKETDMNKVLSALKSSVQYDPTRFEGVKLMFDNINEELNKLQDNIDQGEIACQYQIANIEDKFEWELGAQRLEKISVTNEILKASLLDQRNSFMVSLNNMNEIQTVLIPLVIDRLPRQTNMKIDASTEKTIRALAYGAPDGEDEKTEK